MSDYRLVCAGCDQTPGEIDDYIFAAHENDMAPEDYVWQEEGTLNRGTGRFLCNRCYIRAGMPTAPGGWVVP